MAAMWSGLSIRRTCIVHYYNTAFFVNKMTLTILAKSAVFSPQGCWILQALYHVLDTFLNITVECLSWLQTCIKGLEFFTLIQNRLQILKIQDGDFGGKSFEFTCISKCPSEVTVTSRPLKITSCNDASRLEPTGRK